MNKRLPTITERQEAFDTDPNSYDIRLLSDLIESRQIERACSVMQELFRRDYDTSCQQVPSILDLCDATGEPSLIATLRQTTGVVGDWREMSQPLYERAAEKSTNLRVRAYASRDVLDDKAEEPEFPAAEHLMFAVRAARWGNMEAAALVGDYYERRLDFLYAALWYLRACMMDEEFWDDTCGGAFFFDVDDFHQARQHWSESKFLTSLLGRLPQDKRRSIVAKLDEVWAQPLMSVDSVEFGRDGYPAPHGTPEASD